MTQSNLEKYKADLKKLITDGKNLQMGVQVEYHPERFKTVDAHTPRENHCGVR